MVAQQTISFPKEKEFIMWQKNLMIKKGICFPIAIIKLAIYDVIESWSYLTIKQSLEMFQDYKGDWSEDLNKQTLNDLFDECLTLKFINHE